MVDLPNLSYMDLIFSILLLAETVQWYYILVTGRRRTQLDKLKYSVLLARDRMLRNGLYLTDTDLRSEYSLENERLMERMVCVLEDIERLDVRWNRGIYNSVHAEITAIESDSIKFHGKLQRAQRKPPI